MDYDAFMKSKHIAERWGEAQAAFEQSDVSDETAYYQELLTDFYEYIQFLEAKSFGKEKVEDLTNLSNPLVDFGLPKVPEILSNQQQETVDDEENPWFGFAE